MDVPEYLQVLEDLGIDVAHLTEIREVNNGRVLRTRDRRRFDGVYFNSNRDGVVHFTIHPYSPVTIDWSLWNALPDEQVKRKDQGKPNIYPYPGMERRALRQLLIAG
jgi:hypothetical protein